MQGGRRCYQIYHESIRDWLETSKRSLWDHRQGYAALFVLYTRVTWMLALAKTPVELLHVAGMRLATVEGLGEEVVQVDLDLERRLKQELECFSRTTGEYLNFQFVQNGEGGSYLLSLEVALSCTEYTVETAVYEMANNLSKCCGEGKTVQAAGCMRRLMEVMGLSVDASASKNTNAMVKAIMDRNEAAALLLLRTGADINYLYNDTGIYLGRNRSYVHLASEYGCAKVIELLVEKGADPTATCTVRVTLDVNVIALKT